MYNSKDMNILKSIKLFALSALFTAVGVVAVQAKNYTILAFGDSLTAGYGLAPEQAFPQKLERALRRRGYNISVINGGVSGETSTGGRARLEWVLAGMTSDKPDMVIMELGANDALRGIPPDITRHNIDRMLAILEKAKIPTLVTGMIAPPNMGPEYSAAFNSIFAGLSTKYHDDLYPFFLAGVAGNPGLNQQDAIHPNAKGVDVIVEKIIPFVLKTLAIAGRE